MRYLHPVASHEVFVASGTYRYWQGGAPTGLVEHWTIHEMPDGAWFIRVDKDGRDFDGRSEFIEAWRTPPGDGARIERFDVVASGVPGEFPHRVRASYTIEDNRLYIGRTFDQGERLQTELEVPPLVVVQPGGYVFFGLALPSLVEQAPLPLLMRYSHTTPPEASFTAVITYPTLSYYGEDTVTVSGREREAQRYVAGATRGAAGGVSWHTYWIDSHHIFLLHESDDQTVALERYAHRPATDAKD